MNPQDTLPTAAGAPSGPEGSGQAPNSKLQTPGFGVGAPITNSANALDRFLGGLIDLFASLRLTSVCLMLAMLLVFFGTLAQVDLGLYKAQNEFFRSFIVFWGPKGATWKIPVLPGGYLLGGVLLINLVTAHFKHFSLSRDKVGIWLVHFGLILLLAGQLLTDLLARESTLHLREGEARNFSESERQAELAVFDTTDADSDKVVAIPQGALARGGDIRNAELPFTLRVKEFFANSQVENREATATLPPAATKGIGPRATVKPLPRVTEMDRRDVPSAVVEVVTPQGSLGSWLVSEFIEQPQSFEWNKRSFQLTMRPRRYYKPFSIQLLQFRHDVYPGTDIPKNFSSRVLLQRPDTGESREVLIYMNNPLRYGGETFYQASFDPDDHGTVLQVVHNPSWLTPYLSCILVGLGLVVQFVSHLLNFTLRRRAA